MDQISINLRIGPATIDLAPNKETDYRLTVWSDLDFTAFKTFSSKEIAEGSFFVVKPKGNIIPHDAGISMILQTFQRTEEGNELMFLNAATDRVLFKDLLAATPHNRLEVPIYVSSLTPEESPFRTKGVVTVTLTNADTISKTMKVEPMSELSIVKENKKFFKTLEDLLEKVEKWRNSRPPLDVGTEQVRLTYVPTFGPDIVGNEIRPLMPVQFYPAVGLCQPEHLTASLNWLKKLAETEIGKHAPVANVLNGVEWFCSITEEQFRGNKSTISVDFIDVLEVWSFMMCSLASLSKYQTDYVYVKQGKETTEYVQVESELFGTINFGAGDCDDLTKFIQRLFYVFRPKLKFGDRLLDCVREICKLFRFSCALMTVSGQKVVDKSSLGGHMAGCVIPDWDTSLFGQAPAWMDDLFCLFLEGTGLMYPFVGKPKDVAKSVNQAVYLQEKLRKIDFARNLIENSKILSQGNFPISTPLDEEGTRFYYSVLELFSYDPLTGELCHRMASTSTRGQKKFGAKIGHVTMCAGTKKRAKIQGGVAEEVEMMELDAPPPYEEIEKEVMGKLVGMCPPPPVMAIDQIVFEKIRNKLLLDVQDFNYSAKEITQGRKKNLKNFFVAPLTYKRDVFIGSTDRGKTSHAILQAISEIPKIFAAEAGIQILTEECYCVWIRLYIDTEVAPKKNQSKITRGVVATKVNANPRVITTTNAAVLFMFDDNTSVELVIPVNVYRHLKKYVEMNGGKMPTRYSTYINQQLASWLGMQIERHGSLKEFGLIKYTQKTAHIGNKISMPIAACKD
jgi:hypothetical protein